LADFAEIELRVLKAVVGREENEGARCGRYVLRVGPQCAKFFEVFFVTDCDEAPRLPISG
jgi:hypothetical protein